jgi:hypothetical protein
MKQKTEDNFQKLRMMIAFFGFSQRSAAVQLGVSTTLLRALCAGTSYPDKLTKERIEVLSRRWPHGVITSTSWPAPPPDRRVKAAPPTRAPRGSAKAESSK